METLSKEMKDEWLKSARKYITLTEECDCDCFLCIRGEHDEHCDESNLYDKGGRSMNTTTLSNLSPQARDLLERSLKWLEPAGRWYQGWGIMKRRKQNGGYYEYTIEDSYEFNDQGWREYDEWSEKKQDVITPFAKNDLTDMTSACALGSLLVNNNGLQDEVYREVAEALANLVIDSKLKENPFYLAEQKYGYDYETEQDVRERLLEEFEEVVVNYNDAKDTEGTMVKNLFRRVLGRRTY